MTTKIENTKICINKRDLILRFASFTPTCDLQWKMEKDYQIQPHVCEGKLAEEASIQHIPLADSQLCFIKLYKKNYILL